jgi:choline-sulfatase
MKIIFFDIDTLRPDHLSCYGYHRSTSPNIDAIASDGLRFENCYVSDAPCLPSRSALWTGSFGFRNGVINHGGVAAEPYIDWQNRGFVDGLSQTNLTFLLRQSNLHTVTVSPFGERHAAWEWYAGWNEVYNPGKRGHEIADEITPLAVDWLQRNSQRDNWFLHINYWDPHTPYRTPESYGNPFENEPIADWLTEEHINKCMGGYGPHSAREVNGFDSSSSPEFPHLPQEINSLEAAKRWIDGYDTGIRYADDHVGRILQTLDALKILDEVVIVISSDHGENQGELNVWGDHQTADHITCRIPLIVRWPGVTSKATVDSALHYHFDWAATLLELANSHVPETWDGISFAQGLRNGNIAGRPYLVISQGAWACQRSVRFDVDGEGYLLMRTYHDGYKQLDPTMLFNLSQDPHEQTDLAGREPSIVNAAVRLLDEWHADMMRRSPVGVDPMMTVLREGGPYHTRSELSAYLTRLERTGRAHHAKTLAEKHAKEI